MLSIFCAPSRYVQGRNATSQLGPEMKKLGLQGISAEALALLCYETLLNDGVAALHAVQQQVVTPALERLVEANTLLSGLGFESGGLAVAHSVHNGLTTLPETHNYYHGEKVAFGLIVQLVLEGKSTETINEVLAFSESVGLPICLQDLGLYPLSKEACQQVAVRATAPGETAHNEPFTVSADAVYDAIFAADAIGSAFKACVSSAPRERGTAALPGSDCLF